MMNPSLDIRLAALEQNVRDTRRKLRVVWILSGFAILCGFVLGLHREATAQGGVTLAELAARMTAQEARTQFFTTDGNATSGGNIYFTNANMQILNGFSYRTGNGFGNVMVGYNEMSGAGAQRNGSHCLVIGRYQSYSGTSGILAGESNRVQNDFGSSVSGAFNTVSGICPSISGGIYNTVSGSDWAPAVSGGQSRAVYGDHDWAAGGLTADR